MALMLVEYDLLGRVLTEYIINRNASTRAQFAPESYRNHSVLIKLLLHC